MCREQGTVKCFQNRSSWKPRSLRTDWKLRRRPTQRREDVHGGEGRNVHAEDVGRERFLEAGRGIPVVNDVSRSNPPHDSRLFPGEQALVLESLKDGRIRTRNSSPVTIDADLPHPLYYPRSLPGERPCIAWRGKEGKTSGEEVPMDVRVGVGNPEGTAVRPERKVAENLATIENVATEEFREDVLMMRMRKASNLR
jgi:hypothetical protein